MRIGQGDDQVVELSTVDIFVLVKWNRAKINIERLIRLRWIDQLTSD